MPRESWLFSHVPAPSLVACNGELELDVLETLLHEQPVNHTALGYQGDLNSNRTSEIQIIVLDGMTNRTGAKLKVSDGKALHCMQTRLLLPKKV